MITSRAAFEAELLKRQAEIRARYKSVLCFSVVFALACFATSAFLDYDAWIMGTIALAFTSLVLMNQAYQVRWMEEDLRDDLLNLASSPRHPCAAFD